MHYFSSKMHPWITQKDQNKTLGLDHGAEC